MKNDFHYLVLSIVQEVPIGKVASYSQIARLAGFPKLARKVGSVLSHAHYFGEYPCHRIVHQNGTLVHGWEQQATWLQAEGVTLLNNWKVDMKKYQWKA